MTTLPKTATKTQAPYADALRAYSQRETLRLNVPGHNANEVAASELTDFFGLETLLLDAASLLAGIDKGEPNPLAQALELAARAFNARRTWFLTNGASQANRIAALALAQYRAHDQPVLTQRSAHSSFIDGIVLGGITPAFVMPTIDTEHGINHGVTVTSFTQALAANPSAKGAYVISPSYFGAVADIPALAAAAHAAGLPLVVDAAWGSHFGFHPDLPRNPLTQGADLVISSTHKLGGSLTQSAMLHLGEGPFAAELEPLIDRAFGLTQSTSASALLLASLDIARAALEDGHDRLGISIRVADRLRAAVRAHPLLDVVSDHFSQHPDIVASDPLHVSIDIRGLGRDGNAVRESLMEHFGIYTEISTETCIVAIIGPGHEPDIMTVMDALNALAVPVAANDAPDARRGATLTNALPLPGKTVMLPRDAYFDPRELVAAHEAIGRISADTLAAYPPGIPNILPGELITAETITFLQKIAAIPGGYVRGAVRPDVSRFWVTRA